MRELADRVEANEERLARLLSEEQGKPLAEATAELQGAPAYFRYFAGLDLPVRVMQDDEAGYAEVHHRPLGVVAAITPWNFPMVIAAMKMGPALVSGNTIILKPAPTTPLTSLVLGELCADLFPPGVVSVLADDNDIGPLLTAHPDIAKVSFTGSIETGRRVMESAAGSLKRAGITPKNDVDPPTSMTVRTGWSVSPAENWASTRSMVSMRSAIGRTARTSDSVRRSGMCWTPRYHRTLDC